MKLEWPEDVLKGQGRRLELVARTLGMKDKDIAERIGVSPQAWNNYTKGERPFFAPALIELRKLIPVTLDWLYFGDESGLPVHVLQRLTARSMPVPLHRPSEPRLKAHR